MDFAALDTAPLKGLIIPQVIEQCWIYVKCVYNVAQLLREQVGSTRSYQIDENFIPYEQDSLKNAEGHFALMRTDKGIWATASLENRIMDVCSRCLKLFTKSMIMVIEEEYLPTVDVNTGKSLPISDQTDGTFIIDSNHILDLREAVRQYRITHGSMKPLCRRDCQGLCPSCGGDRNDGACSCEPAVTDFRWAALGQLLERGGRCKVSRE